MALIPASVMPHVKRFGLSGVLALGVVVVMLLGINPVTVLTGQVSPPPPPTSITGVPPASADAAALAAYPPVVGGEAELMWRRAFRITAILYPDIAIDVVPTSAEFGCGMSGKDLTVFYCPENSTVYADTEAYDRLRRQFPLGADYAMAYLVAEAYGHHTQSALGAFAQLVQLRQAGDAAAVEALEKRLDMQAACYAGMWTITAGIAALYDNPAVMAAADAVAQNRQRAIIELEAGKVIPETLATASLAGRKHWYDIGYAIPAGGNCSLSKIEAGGQV